ncbi:unnamed protein product [Somion occarium]|uniref:Pyridoxamine 5'-phosphate oxidase putative domain-containing protein n=1 Tax=Somion occarium TaxID=3059160 RepID=A0ABP1D5Q0_9APHY
MTDIEHHQPTLWSILEGVRPCGVPTTYVKTDKVRCKVFCFTSNISSLRHNLNASTQAIVMVSDETTFLLEQTYDNGEEATGCTLPLISILGLNTSNERNVFKIVKLIYEPCPDTLMEAVNLSESCAMVWILAY